MKKVAVVLSGCGHLDGAEIREAVLTLLELDQQDAKVSIFAPDKDSYDVVNHLTGEKTSEKRNVLIEAARIARGKIMPLSQAKASDFDALIMPGGYGVAKNLSNIAEKGTNGAANPDIKQLILDFFNAKKPIGAICISPALVASIMKGVAKVKLTLGDESDLVVGFGSEHEACPAINVVIDSAHKIVSTPAYMRESRLSDIAVGIARLVKKVLELA